MLCKNLTEVKKRVATMLPPLIADGYRIIGRFSTTNTHFVSMRHVRNRAVLTITASVSEYTIKRNGKTVKREPF